MKDTRRVVDRFSSQAVVICDKPLRLGKKTPWGRISAVGLTGGERYYWMIARNGVVSMMPADVVEAA